MGFLNPWLYTVGKTGHTDITIGGSTGCYGSSQTGISTPHVPYASWNATEGWALQNDASGYLGIDS
jgi:tripeptidyl-peptidase-1